MSEAGNSIAFRYSRLKLVGFLLIGLILFGGAILILLGLFGELSPGSFDYFMLLLATPLFAGLTVYNFVRLFRSSDIINVSSEGIRDVRIGRELIPWSEVQDLSQFEMKGHKFLIVELRPEFERQYKFTLTARLKRAGNKNFGPKGNSIHMNGLNGTFEDLLSAVNQFAPTKLRFSETH